LAEEEHSKKQNRKECNAFFHWIILHQYGYLTLYLKKLEKTTENRKNLQRV